jgi:hypothetical protein
MIKVSFICDDEDQANEIEKIVNQFFELELIKEDQNE